VSSDKIVVGGRSIAIQAKRFRKEQTKRRDRNRSMRRQLKEQGLVPEYIQAVDNFLFDVPTNSDGVAVQVDDGWLFKGPSNL